MQAVKGVTVEGSVVRNVQVGLCMYGELTAEEVEPPRDGRRKGKESKCEVQRGGIKTTTAFTPGLVDNPHCHLFKAGHRFNGRPILPMLRSSNNHHHPSSLAFSTDRGSRVVFDFLDPISP